MLNYFLHNYKYINSILFLLASPLPYRPEASGHRELSVPLQSRGSNELLNEKMKNNYLTTIKYRKNTTSQ